MGTAVVLSTNVTNTFEVCNNPLTFPKKCTYATLFLFPNFFSVHFQRPFWSLKGVKFLLAFGLCCNCRHHKPKSCRLREKGMLLANAVQKSSSASGIAWFQCSDDVMKDGSQTAFLGCPLCYLPSQAECPFLVLSSHVYLPSAEQSQWGRQCSLFDSSSKSSWVGSPWATLRQSLKWYSLLPGKARAESACSWRERMRERHPNHTTSESGGRWLAPQRKINVLLLKEVVTMQTPPKPNKTIDRSPLQTEMKTTLLLLLV